MTKTKLTILPLYSFGIPLLLAALVPYILVLTFWYHQAAIRESLEEKFERTHLTRLELNNSDFRWMKKGKEILVGKRLFDIKKMEKGDATTIFWGIYDDEETDLFENWVDLQGENSKNLLLYNAGLIFLMIGQSEKTEPLFIKSPSGTPQLPWQLLSIAGLPKGYPGQPVKPPSGLT